MIIKNKKFITLSVLLCSLFISCEDLTEANENPNGVQPEAVNPNLVLPTVLTEAGKAYVNWVIRILLALYNTRKKMHGQVDTTTMIGVEARIGHLTMQSSETMHLYMTEQ